MPSRRHHYESVAASGSCGRQERKRDWITVATATRIQSPALAFRAGRLRPDGSVVRAGVVCVGRGERDDPIDSRQDAREGCFVDSSNFARER